MDLLEIIDRIDYLNSQHSRKQRSSVCKCELCKEIQELGKQYEQIMEDRRKRRNQSSNPIKRKINKIVAKGLYATPSEIRYLVDDLQLSKKDIAKMMGVNYGHFLGLCKQLDIGTIYRRGKREEVS